MNDVASLIIEIQKLARQTYEDFNDRDHEKALVNASLLRTMSRELYEVLKHGQ
jgi:hypothetical protein